MKTIALVCSHNGELFIEEQLNSLLKQTIKLDLIVIDDYNSSDRTLAIIKDMVAKHFNMTYNHFKTAHGPTHSFLNSIKTIREAEDSPFLLYLVDQDDVWLPNKNEKVLREFRERESAIIFHDVEIVDERLSCIRETYYRKYWNVARDLKLPNQFFSNCVIGHTCALSSQFLDSVSLEYDERIPMHDWYLVNEALFQEMRITYLGEVLSLYRQHNNNLLGASRSKKNSIIKSLRMHSLRVKRYQLYLQEKYPEKLSYNSLKIIVIIRNIRPLKKLLTILIIKYAIRDDKF